MKRSAIALAACALLVIGAACAPAGLRSRAPAVATTDVEHAISGDLYARLNQERAARGLPPLAYDAGLESRSASWSRTMPTLTGDGNELHHSNLNPLLGAYSAAAENIAWTGGGTSGLVHVSWMNSTGHRDNMLSPNLDVVGIGVYCGPGGQMWVTEDFGRFPNSSRPAGFASNTSPAPIADPVQNGPGC